MADLTPPPVTPPPDLTPPPCDAVGFQLEEFFVIAVLERTLVFHMPEFQP